ncbi:hypothetical protein Tco_0749121 [Tanacetum coccineum]|uniref:Zinc finger, CCHC-type n=1 Tax=Tanacetum coccineum TaxID=301880 RepID=A0ABQ4YYH5_9ASTR
MATAQNINNTTLRSILTSKKLTGLNFTNWDRNLRIILRSENKLVHLEQPLIPLPLPVASQAVRDAYEVLFDAQNEVSFLILGSISPDLQRILEKYKEDGQPVSPYLLKMKGYLDTLECLGFPMPNELSVSLILNSLNKDYDQFIQNYNMHIIGKTIAGLLAMLKLHEKGIPKKAATPVAKILPPLKRDNLAKDLICHLWKEEDKEAENGALNLYIGNGMRASVEAIGSFDLILSNGLVIVLDNYHYVPSITRGVVIVSRLIDNGYMHTILNYDIFVMKDDVLYFNAISRDGNPKETMGYFFYNPHKNKICVFHYPKFFENSLTLQEASRSHRLLELNGSDVAHELCHTSPQAETEQHNEVDPNKVEPHSVKVPSGRSERISKALDRYGFYVDAEEHKLGDIDDPPNYKAVLLDPESDKWLDAMNAKMQFMKDNQV